MNEWFDIDDIDHVYGAQVEDADSDAQFLTVVDQDKNEIFNIPLAEDKLVKANINIDIPQKHDHSYAIDLSNIRGSLFNVFKAAFAPAIRPCAAASSYPDVPFICPAK